MLLDQYLLAGFFLVCALVFQSTVLWTQLRNHRVNEISEYAPEPGKFFVTGSTDGPKTDVTAGTRLIEFSEGLYQLDGVEKVGRIDMQLLYANLGFWGLFQLYLLFKIRQVRNATSEERFRPEPPQVQRGKTANESGEKSTIATIVARSLSGAVYDVGSAMTSASFSARKPKRSRLDKLFGRKTPHVVCSVSEWDMNAPSAAAAPSALGRRGSSTLNLLRFA